MYIKVIFCLKVYRAQYFQLAEPVLAVEDFNTLLWCETGIG
ncbi:hypothetical protein X474_15535 [Dethiosulfatarculus sandiegensis]|uniref:Uncharacterized protein n=1 Tax=Dethiosulfatarculus sandiegensis TaxID=1429043 RepID=A0A0D2J4U5_9BACT|nr:hypothetical protein X474_15535 [Dethiosulfatarculus sandiegensis]